MAGPKGGRSFRKRCTLNTSITPATVITRNCRDPLAASQLVASKCAKTWCPTPGAGPWDVRGVLEDVRHPPIRELINQQKGCRDVSLHLATTLFPGRPEGRSSVAAQDREGLSRMREHRGDGPDVPQHRAQATVQGERGVRALRPPAAAETFPPPRSTGGRGRARGLRRERGWGRRKIAHALE